MPMDMRHALPMDSAPALSDLAFDVEGVALIRPALRLELAVATQPGLEHQAAHIHVGLGYCARSQWTKLSASGANAPTASS